ncbi:MAG: hypothetical protein JNK27_16690 [Chitinophagaceae bacterium]|nr:hypothetical protein [Chitinophagaceae bacterium]
MKTWYNRLREKSITKLYEASYDNFTYHGEDGIILYLLNQMADVPSVFVDIGSGDCIKSNCANLAVHYGWEGIFIDKNEEQLAIGKRFYQSFVNKGQKIRIINEMVLAENINGILSKAGVNGEIGLLSIDIDGNDYWIWKAIEKINPRIVVIEAKVEFGKRDLIVPYGDDNHHSVDKMYNGASVDALRKLGKKKGYKMAGSNRHGYNLFFVRQEENVIEESVDSVLSDPETIQSFYPESFYTTHKFVTVN